MDLRHLQTFHIVSTYLNFTRSADILNYSQPTVSQHIKALEEELGFPLFERIGKRLFLSEEGQMVRQHTDKIFNILGELDLNLKNVKKPHGNLIISAPAFYCNYYLPHIISTFTKLYPHVKLKILTYNSRDTFELVKERKADLGFIASEDLNQSGIEKTLINQEDLLLVASKSIIKGQSIHDLFENNSFITYGIDTVINTCLQEINCYPKNIMQVGDESAIKKSVFEDIGFALLSKLVIKNELSDHSLQVIKEFPNKLPTYIIHPKSSKSLIVKSFINLTTDVWNKM